MLLNDLEKLIFVHLFEQIPLIDNNLLKLQKHKRNLGKNGDISFPIKYECWINKLIQEQLIFDKEKFMKTCVDLKEKSETWPIPIEKIWIKSERCIIHLNKVIAIKYVFSEVLKNSYGKTNMKHNFCIIFPDTVKKDLTNWRLNTIASVLNNVINFCKDEGHTFNNNDLYLHFLVNGCKMQYADKDIVVNCGIVTDRATKKKSETTFNEYFYSRRKDIQLMVMHNYGIRIKDKEYLTQLLDKLGKAAVIVDLVEVKHTSPVQIVKDNRGCSKGATFILYNCARIETILKKFDERTNQKFYLKLPNLEELDFSNLTEEEEWELVFNYLATFPDMVSGVLQGLELGKCAPYLIPKFLNGLAALFSTYYRRVRILLENRDHLMNTIFVRIYLLKSIYKIFKLSLNFLGIEIIKNYKTN